MHIYSNIYVLRIGKLDVIFQSSIKVVPIHYHIQWNLYINTTLGSRKVWSLSAGGLYIQIHFIHDKNSLFWKCCHKILVVFLNSGHIAQVSLYLSSKAPNIILTEAYNKSPALQGVRTQTSAISLDQLVPVRVIQYRSWRRRPLIHTSP